jgi:hypothetical protein
MKMFSYAKTEDDLGLPLHIRIEGRGNPLWLPLVYYYLEGKQTCSGDFI